MKRKYRSLATNPIEAESALYGTFEKSGHPFQSEKSSKWNVLILILLALCILGGVMYFSSNGFNFNVLLTKDTVKEAYKFDLSMSDDSEFVSSNHGLLATTLIVREELHTFEVNNTLHSVYMRTFNGSIPGPILKVKPGDKLQISLANRLGQESSGFAATNTFRKPNTTSLHIHGIHASPVYEDNVFKTCSPGESVIYTYNISKNHPSGTFFLHPHFHGSSTLQIGFAMTSALIIEDTEEVLDVKLGHDIALVIGNYEQGTDNGRDYIRESALAQSTMRLKDGDRMEVPRMKFITLNGKINPVISLQKNIFYRLRFINAAIDGVINIYTLQRVGCEWAEIAADGIYFNEIRVKTRCMEPFPSTIVVPRPKGSRKDILLRCNSSKSDFLQFQSTRNLATAFMGVGTNILEGPLFRVHLVDDATKSAPYSMSEIKKIVDAPHFEDLRTINLKPINRFVVKYNFPGPNTPSYERNGAFYQFYGINGELYSDEVKVKLKLNEVQEWLIVNDYAMDGTVAIESHPFHMHTNHFQVYAVHNPAKLVNLDFREGDWRDTIAIPPGGNVSIRFKPLDFTGKTLVSSAISPSIYLF